MIWIEIVRSARAFAPDRRGVAAVELALLAIPVFALLGIGLHFWLKLGAQMALDQAFNLVARRVYTQILFDPVPSEEELAEKFKTDTCRFMFPRWRKLIDCESIRIDVTRSNVSSPKIILTRRRAECRASDSVIAVQAKARFPLMVNLFGVDAWLPPTATTVQTATSFTVEAHKNCR